MDLFRRRLKRVAKGLTGGTDHQTTSLTEQRNTFRVKLANWEQMRLIYMPGLLQYQADNSHSSSQSSAAEFPEDQELWLPSSIPMSIRDRICQAGLPTIELKLRIAQCHDALRGIRQVLRIKTRMIHFKNKNVRGQRDGTKSRSVIDRVHERARGYAQKYRASRAAGVLLLPSGQWDSAL